MRGFIYYDIQNRIFITIPAKNRIISYNILKGLYPYDDYKYCGEITNTKDNNSFGKCIDMVFIKDKNYIMEV